jgi:hypothetical protein
LLALAFFWVAPLKELASAAGFTEQALKAAITVREKSANSHTLDRCAYNFFMDCSSFHSVLLSIT